MLGNAIERKKMKRNQKCYNETEKRLFVLYVVAYQAMPKIKKPFRSYQIAKLFNETDGQTDNTQKMNDAWT